MLLIKRKKASGNMVADNFRACAVQKIFRGMDKNCPCLVLYCEKNREILWGGDVFMEIGKEKRCA